MMSKYPLQIPKATWAGALCPVNLQGFSLISETQKDMGFSLCFQWNAGHEIEKLRIYRSNKEAAQPVVLLRAKIRKLFD